MNVDQRRPKPGDDNLALLKGDIDSGVTGDKVANPDPGLSPLGTDDEAGGNAPTPAQISLARHQEANIGAHVRGDKAQRPGPKLSWPVVIMASVIAGFLLVIVASFLMSH